MFLSHFVTALIFTIFGAMIMAILTSGGRADLENEIWILKEQLKKANKGMDGGV
mgnify:CR=1 FL=1|jgi:hypothetical protein